MSWLKNVRNWCVLHLSRTHSHDSERPEPDIRKIAAEQRRAEIMRRLRALEIEWQAMTRERSTN